MGESTQIPGTFYYLMSLEYTGVLILIYKVTVFSF